MLIQQRFTTFTKRLRTSVCKDDLELVRGGGGGGELQVSFEEGWRAFHLR